MVTAKMHKSGRNLPRAKTNVVAKENKWISAVANAKKSKRLKNVQCVV